LWQPNRAAPKVVEVVCDENIDAAEITFDIANWRLAAPLVIDAIAEPIRQIAACRDRDAMWPILLGPLIVLLQRHDIVHKHRID